MHISNGILLVHIGNKEELNESEHINRLFYVDKIDNHIEGLNGSSIICHVDYFEIFFLKLVSFRYSASMNLERAVGSSI